MRGLLAGARQAGGFDGGLQPEERKSGVVPAYDHRRRAYELMGLGAGALAVRRLAIRIAGFVLAMG